MEMFNSANAQFRPDFHVHDCPTPGLLRFSGEGLKWASTFFPARVLTTVHGWRHEWLVGPVGRSNSFNCPVNHQSITSQYKVP